MCFDATTSVITFSITTLSAIYLYNISDVNTICEKGYIYFIEFINQLSINNTSDSNIELSLKDAIIFSYKKTIFNLDKNSQNINSFVVLVVLVSELQLCSCKYVYVYTCRQICLIHCHSNLIA